MSESVREEYDASEDEFGLNAVRELLRLISDSDVTEIKIERGSSKLHIRRGTPANTNQPILVTPSLASAMGQVSAGPLPPITPAYATEAPRVAGASPDLSATSEPQLQITAPMVGTFYVAASPKDPPFINVGDVVHVGDVVGIVEAMKIMNEIESEFDGRVVHILVSNGQSVEYGQPLMVVEPV